MPENTEEKKVFEVEVARKVTLTQQDIDDLITTALEGGINHWCDKVTLLTPMPEGAEWLSEAVSRGGMLTLHYDGGNSVNIDLGLVLNGIKLWMERFSKGYGIQSADANDADNIVQLAVFGEVVYG